MATFAQQIMQRVVEGCKYTDQKVDPLAAKMETHVLGALKFQSAAQTRMGNLERDLNELTSRYRQLENNNKA